MWSESGLGLLDQGSPSKLGNHYWPRRWWRDLEFPLLGLVQPVSNAEASRPAEPTVPRLALAVAADLWHLIKPLVIFESVFKAVAIGLGALGTAWIISPLIARTGRAAVTNTDIARFLASPPGALAVVVMALSFVLGTMLEHVGVIAIAACHLRGRDVTPAETLAALKAVATRLVSFSFAQLVAMTVLCAPFVLLAGLGYVVLLSHHDINFYLANRPWSWYLALAMGGGLAIGLASIVTTLYVSTIFAAPLLLFENRSVLGAVRESRARTKGARLRIGAIVLGWQLLSTLAGFIAVWGFGRTGALALDSAGAHPAALVPVAAILLAGHALLLAVLSFVAVAIHCLLILRLYLARR